MRKPVVTAVAGLLVFAAIVAGCGGGGGGKLKAAEFADKTCPDLGDWGKAVSGAFGDLQNLSDTTDPETAKKKLSSALGDLDKATAKLASSIDGRAAPDVQSGDQIKKELVDAFTKFRQLARDLRTKVDNFDIENASSDDLESFSSEFDDFGSDTDKTFKALDQFSDNSDLDHAFSDSKACEQAQAAFSDFSS
jgi:hypothetical protein